MIWVLVRLFSDTGSCQIEGIFSSREKADAAMAADPNPEPMYGKLEVQVWPVDA